MLLQGDPFQVIKIQLDYMRATKVISRGPAPLSMMMC